MKQLASYTDSLLELERTQAWREGVSWALRAIINSNDASESEKRKAKAIYQEVLKGARHANTH